MAQQSSGDADELQALINVLQGQLQFLKDQEPHVDALIEETPCPQQLRDAKRKSLEIQRKLLSAVVANLNPFLESIVLYQNKLDHIWANHQTEAGVARQRYCTHLSKYEMAKKCESDVQNFQSLGFAAYNYEEVFTTAINQISSALKEEGITVHTESGANRKKIDRAFYKSFFIYKSARKMTDMLRASYVFDSFDDLYRAFRVIERVWEPYGGILRAKDRFALEHAPFGYRDLLINVFAPNSPIVCELQLHHVSLYSNKKGSHAIYKKARVFNTGGVNQAFVYAEKYIRPTIGKDREPCSPRQAVEPGQLTAPVPRAEVKELASIAEDCSRWRQVLDEFQLGKFASKFEDCGWDAIVDWPDMTHEDLAEMGVVKGHLRKWSRLIAKVRSEAQEPAPVTPGESEGEGERATQPEKPAEDAASGEETRRRAAIRAILEEDSESSDDDEKEDRELFNLLFRRQLGDHRRRSQPQPTPRQQRTVEPSELPRRRVATPTKREGSVQCPKCGANMKKMLVREKYRTAQAIRCDGCKERVSRNTEVFHCEAGQTIEHPNAFDLCTSCASQATETTKRSCQCGGTLEKTTPGETYGNGACCDVCRSPIRPSTPMYHCAEGRNASHRGGYDVCQQCFRTTREFVYERDMDENGVMYWLGTNKGKAAWRNPMSGRRLVRVKCGSPNPRSDNIAAVVGREVAQCATTDEESAAFVIELLGVKVLPKRYTLRHYTNNRNYIRNWVLQASNPDMRKWVTLKRHESDDSLRIPGEAHTWKIDADNRTYFSEFRILASGPNSSRNNILALSGFEIYGTVIDSARDVSSSGPSDISELNSLLMSRMFMDERRGLRGMRQEDQCRQM